MVYIERNDPVAEPMCRPRDERIRLRSSPTLSHYHVNGVNLPEAKTEFIPSFHRERLRLLHETAQTTRCFRLVCCCSVWLLHKKKHISMLQSVQSYKRLKLRCTMKRSCSLLSMHAAGAPSLPVGDRRTHKNRLS